MSLSQELKVFGSADVIVVLQDESSAAASSAAARSKEPRSVPAKRVQRAALNALKSHFLPADQERGEEEELVAAAGSARSASRSRRSATPDVQLYENLGILIGCVNRDGWKALKENPQVAAVHAAPAISLIRPTKRQALASLSAATAVTQGYTWGLKRLGVPELRAAGLTGAGVLVGHLDTGVDGTHPSLQGAIAHFAEFDLRGRQVPDAIATDSDEHGTHTAGTILGRKTEGIEFGVAPGAMLASAMVIDGGQVVRRVLAGMDWAVGFKVRILSMSLGFRGYVEDFLPLTRLLRRRNILPVFAVGNEGKNTSRSPGNYAEALSVGASDESDAVADFSSSRRFVRGADPRVPDLVAPGVAIASCIPGNRYAEFDGTSMATSHLAGLAALLMEARPTASAADIERAILASCSRPASMPASRANRGIPYGPKALQQL